MNKPRLFADEGDVGQAPTPGLPTHPDQARLNKPVRNQIEMTMQNLDSRIPEDHPARGVWAFVETMNLEAFYTSIKAVAGSPGRPTTDPQVLLALWLFATAEGIGSARRLARLCEEHDAFRWLRGGVPINYHMLADFRVQHGAALNGLLTELLATLMAAEIVSVKRVSQDGMRVRASAGAGSFRREPRLKELLALAEEQVTRLAEELEHPDGATTRREEAARERAAQERKMRVAEALKHLPEVRAAKKTDKAREQARASTTDAEARVMKMPDGGFRPAYNVQLATDTETQVIVGVAVTNQGTDSNQAMPMLDQITRRCGTKPDEYLADGGFATLKTVRDMAKNQVTLYAPIKPPRGNKRKKTTPRSEDTPEIAAWRIRMGTDEAGEIYKERAATSECVNAQFRQRHGAYQFNIRGLVKVTAVAILMTLTHNMFRWMALM